jgi:hypothetical protein
MISYLILLQPLLQELLPALLEDIASRLNKFKMVQLVLLEEYCKMEERLLGGAGKVLNDSITCTVRRIPWRKYEYR